MEHGQTKNSTLATGQYCRRLGSTYDEGEVREMLGVDSRVGVDFCPGQSVVSRGVKRTQRVVVVLESRQQSNTGA